MSSSRSSVALFALLLLVVTLVACGPTDPVAKVIQERNQNYTVELTGWFPKKVDVLDAMVDAASDATADAAEGIEDAAADVADAVAEGDADAVGDALAEGADALAAGAEEIGEAVTGPTTETIVFDVAVIYQGRNPLPGVTVEVAHVDSTQTEKETWLEYLETGEMRTGESRQTSFEIADVELVEGDAFSVTLLQAVPAEDYAEYPEIVAAQP
ncbi:MAG: hypothetical protein AAGC60_06505 [Acidobacteriota bacterium]